MLCRAGSVDKISYEEVEPRKTCVNFLQHRDLRSSACNGVGVGDNTICIAGDLDCATALLGAHVRSTRSGKT